MDQGGGNVSEIQIDLRPAIRPPAIGVVLAGFGEVGAARLAGTFGDGDDLGGGDAGLGEEIPDDGRAARGEAFVVVFRAEGIGVSAEGEFLAGVRFEDHGDDLKLPSRARVHLVFVELEIECERVATSGVFDER